MPNVPMKLVVSVGGVEEYVPLSAAEIEQRELDAIEFATRQAEMDAAKAIKDALKASAKAKLVAGEALTDEEAATIVI